MLNTKWLARSFKAYNRVESTNDIALEAIRQGAEHGTTIFADEQTCGKGSQSRHWFSPAGVNIYTTCIFRPTWSASHAPFLTLVAARAIVDTLGNLYGINARIKQPNDVLVGKKKIAGILSESSCQGSHIAWAMVGIGININLETTNAPADLQAHITSVLDQLGHAVERELLMSEMYRNIESWYYKFEQDGPEILNTYD